VKRNIDAIDYTMVIHGYRDMDKEIFTDRSRIEKRAHQNPQVTDILESRETNVNDIDLIWKKIK
jgi:hypothetical protein